MINMDNYHCVKCRHSFLVKSTDKDLHLLKANMRCPNFATCEGKINKRRRSTKTVEVNSREMTALDIFVASSGLGLPEELHCSIDDVRKVMVGAKILSVALAEAPDSNRTILLSMTLSTGKTIHVATSVKGATIYKMTEVNHGSQLKTNGSSI